MDGDYRIKQKSFTSAETATTSSTTRQDRSTCIFCRARRKERRGEQMKVFPQQQSQKKRHFLSLSWRRYTLRKTKHIHKNPFLNIQVHLAYPYPHAPSIIQKLLYVVSFHSVVVVTYPQAANRLRGGKKKLIEHCFPPKTIKTKLLP